MSNRLIHASSPYLLQHAHNPVDWYEWGDEALQRAKTEDKPILVSIGYSACHWCHVMEKQCFENVSLAETMNRHFICIKIDREERPDIDHIYMDAIHAMGLQGGWPLNVFLLPTLEPFYGGTYFPPAQWNKVLVSIAQAYQDQREAIVSSAEGFARSLGRLETERYGLRAGSDMYWNDQIFETAFKNLEKNFDPVHGGNNWAPKFPMPAVYVFLLRYFLVSKNDKAFAHLSRTLHRMAMGGIYDQIGGGFARYSTDEQWLVPHFEKMLYDNGQLLSLYAQAYAVQPETIYKETIDQTIAFLQAEMLDASNGFYSAFDADSEGEEGKYYVWKREEFLAVLEPEEQVLAEYFNIVPEGNWEHGNNIPHRTRTDAAFASQWNIDGARFAAIKSEGIEKLYSNRLQRIKPGLDDKILCSWNAWMVIGLCDSYVALENPVYLTQAQKTLAFMVEQFWDGNTLFRNYKAGKTSINGFLEDYAAFIKAHIVLFGITAEGKLLDRAYVCAQKVIEKFWDAEEGLFFFTEQGQADVLVRKKELMDNVIPSSNAVMFENLFFLGHLTETMDWLEKVDHALQLVSPLVVKEPYHMSHWASLALVYAYGLPLVHVYGPDAHIWTQNLRKQYPLPAVIVAGTVDTKLSFANYPHPEKDKTIVYVCKDFSCRPPVETMEEAMDLLIGRA